MTTQERNKSIIRQYEVLPRIHVTKIAKDHGVSRQTVHTIVNEYYLGRKVKTETVDESAA